MGKFMDWLLQENRAQENVPDSSTFLTPDVEAELLRAILTGSQIDRGKASEIAVVAACVNLIGYVVASLPVKLYVQNGEQVEEITEDDRLFLLNHDTKDTFTSTQFWKAMIEDYYLGKGGYAYINKDYSKYKSLHHVENGHIGYMMNEDPIFKDYQILVDGKKYEPFDFFKILRKTNDGIHNISLQEENPTIMNMAYCYMVFESKLIQKGGNKKGFFTSENQLSTEAKLAVKEAYRKLYSNGDDSESTMVLNKGMDFKESSNTCVEMQLNENKEFNENDISMLFLVPLSLIKGGASQADKDNFIAHCILPLVNVIENSLDRDLLTEDEKEKKMYFAFDIKELTRGNILDRYRAYELAYNNNFMQVDEIREKEDMPPIGFDFIKLGLDSVLYNPKTKELYTPNTGETANLDDLRNGAGVSLDEESMGDDDGSDLDGMMDELFGDIEKQLDELLSEVEGW